MEFHCHPYDVWRARTGQAECKNLGYAIPGCAAKAAAKTGAFFHELCWTGVEAVFRSPLGGACYHVCYDLTQDLSVDDPALPEELGRPYEVPVNCRNTVGIAALAGYENLVFDGVPQGDDPVLVHARTRQNAFRKAGQLVLRPCQPGQGGLARPQVAVLVPTI